jgi:hypothetical protein
MDNGTLAARLGVPPHLSPLLMKLRRLGITSPSALEGLAVERGLRYYDPHGDSLKGRQSPPAQNASLTHEEIAIALLCPAAPYSQQRIRMGAAMLAAEGNQPATLARLAVQERCQVVVRHIAACGREVEPGNPFWEKLLGLLPVAITPPPPAPDVLPHLSRFVAMTGITRAGVGIHTRWIRPVIIPEIT